MRLQKNNSKNCVQAVKNWKSVPLKKSENGGERVFSGKNVFATESLISFTTLYSTTTLLLYYSTTTILHIFDFFITPNFANCKKITPNFAGVIC